MERLQDEWGLGGKLIGLGIDRVDYTKGIPHRFRAVGRFLEKYPEYQGKLTFVQAGVLSRSDIDAYQQLSEQIDQLLAEINGRFARDGWQPIIYMPNDLPAVTLMALRRLSRFCIVSSLHDGMNLVAKEGPVVNTRGGVLILSETTGAYNQLKDGALSVSPADIEGTMQAMYQALTMGVEERARRANCLRETVEQQDNLHWLESQLQDIETLLLQGSA
jgi:trehalose 6-phosphate synthase